MKILFSPSEAKRSGGEVDGSRFSFGDLYAHREVVLDCYTAFVRSASEAELAKLFGVKKLPLDAREDLRSRRSMKAIRRYSGVAYDYLDYNSLSEDAREFIDRDVIIFSNLFGPILAGDLIPEYKLLQGEKIGDFAPFAHYKKHFSTALDQLLGGEEVLDLRAGFYEKFYTIKSPYTTMKFMKNGKVVSHYAKAYRGLVVREMARHGVRSMEDLGDLEIEALSIKEIRRSALKNELIYELI
ncbi:MAG: YaaA family protein [Sulfuricurvum sp.]